MDGAVRVRSQNLKSVSTVSAAAPSLSKNTPNTASRERGWPVLEGGTLSLSWAQHAALADV